MAKSLDIKNGELYLDDNSFMDLKAFRKIHDISKFIKYENAEDDRIFLSIYPVLFAGIECSANIVFIDQKFQKIIMRPTLQGYKQAANTDIDADQYTATKFLYPAFVSRLSSQFSTQQVAFEDVSFRQRKYTFKNGGLSITCSLGHDDETVDVSVEKGIL